MQSLSSSKRSAWEEQPVSDLKSDRKQQLMVEIELKSKLNSIQRTEKNKKIKEI